MLLSYCAAYLGVIQLQPQSKDVDRLFLAIADRDEDIELILQHFGLPQTDAESFGLRLPYGRLRQRAAERFAVTTSD